MEYRRLGRAGIKVSAVSLGGWLTFGNQIDQTAVDAVVHGAIDAGINYFDLADVYAKGQAESAFGARLGSYERQHLVISTKAYWPMSDAPNDRGLSRKHLFASIEGSLRRLGTDYVDVYFCHRFDPDVELEEIVMAMDDLVRQGKILYWGTSVWPVSKIVEAVGIAKQLGCHPPRAEQPRYNMLDRHIEPEIMPAAAQHGIGLVVWSPLAQGILTGKYGAGVPEGSRAASFDWVRRNLRQADIEAAERLRPVADDLGVPLSVLALAWCLRRPEISSVITGASSEKQVTENAAAAALELDAEVLQAIEEVLGNQPAPLPS